MNSRLQFGPHAAAYAVSRRHATGAAYVVDFALPQPHEVAVDIATGAGHTAHVLAGRCRYVLATDITPEMLRETGRIAAGLELPNLGLGLAMAEALPFAVASLDVVTCRVAPHHFQDVSAFCRELRRVLKPSGRAVVHDTIAPEDDEVAAWVNDVELHRDPSHVEDLKVSAWRALLEGAGLEVVRVQTEHNPDDHEFEDWARRSGTPAQEAAYLRRCFESASPAVVEALTLRRQGGTYRWGWQTGTFLVRPRP
jgi:ubiquinone/menaquinone biosynthesis C-methylase UbiE